MASRIRVVSCCRCMCFCWGLESPSVNICDIRSGGKLEQRIIYEWGAQEPQHPQHQRICGGSFAGGYYFKLSSQPCSLRRAHTDPFPLAMRVIQVLVMLLGILVDKFPMNSNTSTDCLGGSTYRTYGRIIFKNTFLGTGYVLLPRRASCLGISRAVFVQNPK